MITRGYIFSICLLVTLFLPNYLLGVSETFPPLPAKIKLYTGFSSPDKEIIHAILKEAYKRIGIDAEVLMLPAQRALLLANSEGDGAAGRVKSIKKLAPHETSNMIMVPEAITTLRLAVFTKGLDFPVKGWSSLKPYRNGARIGAKILETNVPQDRERVMQPTNIQLFKMLAEGRIDTVVEWENFGLGVIKELQLSEIKALPNRIVVKDFFHLLHIKHTNLVPKITNALKQMKDDGSYQRIHSEILAEML
jgi:polar amino acid transport system substrate-binding protein